MEFLSELPPEAFWEISCGMFLGDVSLIGCGKQSWVYSISNLENKMTSEMTSSTIFYVIRFLPYY